MAYQIEIEVFDDSTLIGIRKRLDGDALVEFRKGEDMLYVPLTKQSAQSLAPLLLDRVRVVLTLERVDD